MDINQIKSNLKMENFYFKNFSFSREAHVSSGEYGIDIKRNITKIKDHRFNIEIETLIEKEDMHLSLIANAEFLFDAENYSNEETIINDNTVAIMFPFIRSQITLMTSQPGMTPIILPAINTKKLK